MFAELNLQQVIFFIILISAFILLMTERIRNDLVAVLIILSLTISKILEPQEALAGFGSEPAIVVAAIFVLSAGLYHTGLSDTFGAWIGRLAGASYGRALAVIMPSVALLSAFTHHLTTTAVMLPVTLNVSRQREIPASKLLIPLSFAASLGTTITIIGAPAFLIASDILQRAGRPGLGIFSIAPIGITLSLVGTLFMLVIGRFLLPSHKGNDDGADRFRLHEYFTELVVQPEADFVGKSCDELHADERYQFRIGGWVRDGRRLRRPFRDRRVRPGDVLLIRTTPEEMVAIRQEPGIEIHPIAQYGENHKSDDGQSEDMVDILVQAIVAPRSELVGTTIGDVNFRERYGAIVVGLWRRSGWVQQELSRIKLREGDVLVLYGEEDALRQIANERAFLLIIPFHGEPRLRRKAPLAGLIMLGTVLAAALGVLSIEIATLAGGLAMVLSGCLTTRQAYRAIDTRIFVFIAGAIPLGQAMEKTGASGLLAEWLKGTMGGLSQLVVLLLLFAVAAVLTQLMSDAATTALFAPVAVVLAQALGHPPEPYVVTVAMGAVASFLTPIGHHGNLLVYSPGRYQFSDFIKVGTPLTILVAVVVTVLAQVLWRA